MKYWAPINSPGGINGNDAYINANPPQGIQGSIPTFESFEQPLRGLSNLVIKSNRTPSASINDYQITDCVRSQWLNWTQTFGGSANDLTAHFDPTPNSLPQLIGVPIHGIASFRNTGPCTLTMIGLATRPIVFPDGTQLRGEEIAPNAILTFMYDGTNFQILGMTQAPGIPPGKLTRPLILYVRLDGNDNNDGSINDAAHAFRTGQAAMKKAFTYGPGEFGCTIQFGQDGLYVGGISTYPWAGPDMTINGNMSNQSLVILRSPAGGNVITCQGVNSVTVNNLRLEAPAAGAGNNLLWTVSSNARLTASNVDFGPCGFICFGGSGFMVLNNYRVYGNCGNCILEAEASGYLVHIQHGGEFLAPVSAPQFCYSVAGGTISHVGNSYSGYSLTGGRGMALLGGGVDTLGGGEFTLPGSTAFQTQAPGWFR